MTVEQLTILFRQSAPSLIIYSVSTHTMLRHYNNILRYLLVANCQNSFSRTPRMDQNMFKGGVEEFELYHRNDESKKTRQQKKRQKLQKMVTDLQDPQKKKQRQNIRRNQEKAKLKRELEGMTEEQVRVYLDNKRQHKRLVKEKLNRAVDQGMPILIDLVYENKMNPKENKSLAVQVQLIMKTIRHIQNPPGIHLCSVGGFAQAQLEKMGYKYWTLKSYSDNVVDIAKKMGKKAVYLSPDAPEPLQTIEQDTAFVIGGLVDRTVQKNASLMRAKDLQMPAYHLPVRQMMKSRTCLNLDHVVMMLCKFQETRDWKQAFEYGAPKRWKRTSQSNNLGKQQSQTHSHINESSIKQESSLQQNPIEKDNDYQILE